MPQRQYKPSQQTKRTILQHAVELFNELGTAAVSLNALAAATGISLGNLQYHYKSKEDIIRAIYELMFDDWQLIYVGVDESFTVETLRTILRANFTLTWKYRFFYREFAALLRADPQLAARFRAVQSQRLAEQETLFRQLAANAEGRAASDPQQIKSVILIGWVLGNTWLSYIESSGQVVDQTVLDEAVEMMLRHYRQLVP